MGTGREELERLLAEEHKAYVLITCDEPTKTGHMHIEMSHHGDADLTCYLLQEAQTIIEEDEIEA